MKTLYSTAHKKEDTIITQDGYTVKVSALVESCDIEGVSAFIHINTIYANFGDKISVDITSQVLSNQTAVDLIMSELYEVYDDLVVRGVSSDFNVFNGTFSDRNEGLCFKDVA